MRIRFALFFLLTACAFASETRAARITAPGLHATAVKANDKVSSYWPSDPVLCDLVLEGAISDGDSRSLERAFKTIEGSWDSFTFFLCLRSRGGSVQEALKIAQFLMKTERPSIATVVEDGQTCASACALIFLAGNAPARVGAWPQRFLHPRGRLLFHSSRMDLDTYSDDELRSFLNTPDSEGRGLKGKIVDLYRDGLRDVQNVIQTFKRDVVRDREDLGEPWIRPSLFLEMFGQDWDEWICVDTVDAVGRWNIQVFGYSPPAKPKASDYFNVCHNVYGWRSDKFSGDVDLEENYTSGFKQRTYKSEGKFQMRSIVPYQAVMARLSCVVQESWWSDKKGKVPDKDELDVHFENAGGTKLRVSPTAFFTGSTLLPDLPSVRKSGVVSSTVPSAETFRSYPHGVMNGCTYKSIPKSDQRACQSSCASDAACAAYSHNKFTGTCDLKHTLTAIRIDPAWTSGLPEAKKQPTQSSRS